jgi:hypothetical protein
VLWAAIGIRHFGAAADVLYDCQPSRALLFPDGEIRLQISVSVSNADEAIHVGGPALIGISKVAVMEAEPVEIFEHIHRHLASRRLKLRWCLPCSCEGSTYDQALYWNPARFDQADDLTLAFELEDHGPHGEPFVDMCFFVMEEAETFSHCTMRVPRLGAHPHLLAEIDRRSDQLIDRAELVRESCGSDRREPHNSMPIENGHLSPERIEAAEPGLFRAFQDLQGYVFGAAHTAHDDVFIAGSAGLFPSGNRASHVQAVEYLRLARQPWIKTVCEVGFNWGGSSLLWLWTKPDLKVLAFDLMDKSYSWDALRWLQSKFPNRIEVIPGDSNRTLSAHNFDVPCDLILVDADHTLNSELNNILLMLCLTRRTGICSSWTIARVLSRRSQRRRRGIW